MACRSMSAAASCLSFRPGVRRNASDGAGIRPISSLRRKATTPTASRTSSRNPPANQGQPGNPPLGPADCEIRGALPPPGAAGFPESGDGDPELA